MKLLIALAALVLAGCDRHPRDNADGYARWQDRLAVRAGLQWMFQPCWYSKDDGEVLAHEPTDQCYRMQNPRRWQGLWRADFEGSQFCPAPATVCTFDSTDERIWLSGFDKVETDGKLYRVEFIGRRTLHPGQHGHMGASAHEIIVDRPISIREVKEEKAGPGSSPG